MLSPAQVAHYRRHGYVVVRDLVGGTEIALLRDAVRQLLDEPRWDRTSLTTATATRSPTHMTTRSCGPPRVRRC